MSKIYISTEDNAKLSEMQLAACTGYANHEVSVNAEWLKENKDETVNGGQLQLSGKKVTFRTSWNRSENKAVCVLTVDDGTTYEM